MGSPRRSHLQREGPICSHRGAGRSGFGPTQSFSTLVTEVTAKLQLGAPGLLRLGPWDRDNTDPSIHVLGALPCGSLLWSGAAPLGWAVPESSHSGAQGGSWVQREGAGWRFEPNCVGFIFDLLSLNIFASFLDENSEGIFNDCVICECCGSQVCPPVSSTSLLTVGADFGSIHRGMDARGSGQPSALHPSPAPLSPASLPSSPWPCVRPSPPPLSPRPCVPPLLPSALHPSPPPLSPTAFRFHPLLCTRPHENLSAAGGRRPCPFP